MHAISENETQRFNLTTEAVGLADSKEERLRGIIVSPDDIHKAVVKVFTLLGLDPVKDIYTVRVGCDENNRLHIYPEVRFKALVKLKRAAEPVAEKPKSIWDMPAVTDEGDTKIDKSIFAALRNKAYYDHLEFTKVYHDDTKYVRFEFDPEIFLAFIYDIPYANPYYKVSCSRMRMLHSEDFHKMPSEEAKKIKRYQAGIKEVNLFPTMVYVFWSTKGFVDENGNTITKFTPAQVEYFNAANGDKKKKKKKKKKDKD